MKDMNLQKQIARLEVAYEIVSKAHSDICHNSSRSDAVNIAELSSDACHALLHLISALVKIEKENNHSIIEQFAEKVKESASHGWNKSIDEIAKEMEQKNG